MTVLTLSPEFYQIHGFCQAVKTVNNEHFYLADPETINVKLYHCLPSCYKRTSQEKISFLSNYNGIETLNTLCGTSVAQTVTC